MKIKADFVTNSSSTSVVMWGTELETKDFIDAYRKLYELNEEFRAKSVFGDQDDDAFSEDMWEATQDIGSFTGLETYWNYESGYVLVGLSPFSMKDDETLQEFKQKVCDRLSRMCIDKETNALSAIDEVAYD